MLDARQPGLPGAGKLLEIGARHDSALRVGNDVDISRRVAGGDLGKKSLETLARTTEVAVGIDGVVVEVQAPPTRPLV
jgi:hypothetical protein